MKRVLWLLTLAALAAPATLPAQDRMPRGIREVANGSPNARSGLWFSGGLAAGAESFDANDGLGWSDDQWGGVASLRLGGTVSRSLLLGAELSGWKHGYGNGDYDRVLGSLLFIAQWYPERKGAFFFKGGAGLAEDRLYLNYQPSVPTTTRQTGFAMGLGLGYDFRVGRMVSLTPTLDLIGHWYDGYQERLLNIGMAVTLH